MATLVTGATGFIGSHVVQRLPDAIPLTRQDADLTQPLPALPHAGAIIHCAAEIDDPSVMRAVNVDGTRHLVEASLAAGIRTFVYLSTGGVKGQYAETKREAESIILAASARMNVSVLRLFFPYGAGQHDSRLMPRLVASVRAGIPVQINADGGPHLSLTYIDDAVEGILRMLPLDGSRVADLGGPPASLQDVAITIGRLIGREPLFEIRSEPAENLVADRSVLAQTTGFVAATTIEEGLARCI
jgi:nucleoside-diphosphate-sugar epimerase